MEPAAREWPARLEVLPEVCGWVAARAVADGADADAAQDLRLAVEEIAINAINYGYPGRAPGRLAVEVKRAADSIVVVLRDDADPFPPDRAPEPDLAAPVESRKIGGLGWYLVRHLMQEVHHRPLGERGNEVTLVRRLDCGRPPQT
jgi:anti-sigma regulatory factor (Ser/Thr protein kinase)